jgi:hypothetical protein
MLSNISKHSSDERRAISGINVTHLSPLARHDVGPLQGGLEQPHASPEDCSGDRERATTLRRLQEQSQMINSANGTPMPMAPPIIDAQAENRFPSERNSLPDISLLHEPPRVLPVAQG